MLASSVGFANLLSQSRLAVGAGKTNVDRNLGFRDLIGIGGTLVVVSKSTQRLEMGSELVTGAAIAEAERATDRALRQFATYRNMITATYDPSWAVVTGYYAAFFAANAALSWCGRGFCRLDSKGGSVAPGLGGLCQASIAPGSYTGTLEIEFTRVGKNSHVRTWNGAVALASEAAGVAGGAQGDRATFASLADMIRRPTLVSAERNRINYDTSVSPFHAQPWRSAIPALVDASAVAERVLYFAGQPSEARFELLAAGWLSLCGEFQRDFALRGGRRDPRRGTRRSAWFPAGSPLAWVAV